MNYAEVRPVQQRRAPKPPRRQPNVGIYSKDQADQAT